MILLSVTGTVRMILIIIAVIVAVRFFGRLMATQRKVSEDERVQKQNERFKQAKEKSEREKGKIEILNQTDCDAEDVDFEEIKE